MTEQKHNRLLVHMAEAVLELHENLQEIFGNSNLQDWAHDRLEVPMEFQHSFCHVDQQTVMLLFCHLVSFLRVFSSLISASYSLILS